MGKLRANQSIVVTVNGKPIGVREGEAFDPSSAVVRDFPWLFADDTVERATAAPGERRNVKRR